MISPRGFADSTSADRTEAPSSHDASSLAPQPNAPGSEPSALGPADETHFDVPELIPARMLNEFAYCPRLCYLEWVQGEWADNLETHQGTFGHRVVDQPTRKTVPTGKQEPEEEPSRGGTVDESSDAECHDTEVLHARSLTLSAPS